MDSVLIDVRYALRQLRQYRDVQRAIDALERVEEALELADENGVAVQPVDDGVDLAALQAEADAARAPQGWEEV